MKKLIIIFFLALTVFGYGQKTYYLKGFPYNTLNTTLPTYSEHIVGLTPSNYTSIYFSTYYPEPSLTQMTNGTYTCGLYIQSGSEFVSMQVRLIRTSAIGTEIEYSGYSSPITASTGTKSIELTGITWTTGDITDLFKVEYLFINAADNSQYVVFRVGTGYPESKVETPFTEVQRRIFNIN